MISVHKEQSTEASEPTQDEHEAERKRYEQLVLQSRRSETESQRNSMAPNIDIVSAYPSPRFQ